MADSPQSAPPPDVIPADSPLASQVQIAPAAPPAPVVPAAPDVIPADSPLAAQIKPVVDSPDVIPADSQLGGQVVPYVDVLKKLPRNQIVQRYIADRTAGTASNVKDYEDAYAARAAEGNLTGDVNLNEPAKALSEPDRNAALLGLKSDTPDGPTPLRRALDLAKNLDIGALSQAAAIEGVLRGKTSLIPNADGSARELTPEEYKQNAAELRAGMETGTLNTLGMLRQFVVNIANKYTRTTGNADDKAAYKDQFHFDVQLEDAKERVAHGGSAFERPGAFGFLSDPEKVDPATVEAISMSPGADLSILTPGLVAARGVGAAGAVTRAGTVIEAGAAPEASLAARTLARTVETASAALQKGQSVIQNSPAIVRGGVAALGSHALGADAAVTTVMGLLGRDVKASEIFGAAVDKGTAALDRTAAALRNPVPAGPVGKFVQAAYADASETAKNLMVSQAYNLPFALGAESRDDFENAVMTGLIAHGAGQAAGSINNLSPIRNMWHEASRSPGERAAVKDYGIDAGLDAMHRDTVKIANNEGNNLIQAARNLLTRMGSEGEVYLGRPEAIVQNLQDMAARGVKFYDPENGTPIQMTPEVAKFWADQSGVSFLAENPPETTAAGQPPVLQSRRSIALVPFSEGAPAISLGHELWHTIENTVLSPEERTHFEQATAQIYGEEGLQNARRHYAQLLGVDPSTISNQRVLSELMGETFSGRLNAIPVGSFGPNGEMTFKNPAYRKYVRNTAALVEKVLNKLGGKIPETATPVTVLDSQGNPYTTMRPGDGGIRSGLGWELSSELGSLVDNFLESKRIDSGVAEAQGQPDPFTEEHTAPTAENPIQNVKEIAPEPAFKKGDPIDEVKATDGTVIATDAVVSKVFADAKGDHHYEIEFTDPADGKRKSGLVPEKFLQSPVREGAGPIGETTKAQRGIESVAKPGASKPNAREVTAAERARFGTPPEKATPEVLAHNQAVVADEVGKAASQQRLLQTDYYSASEGSASDTGPVREERRKFVEAADPKVTANLRATYDKLIHIYKYEPNPKNGRPFVTAFSFDNFIANSKILDGWLRQNGLKNDPAIKLMQSPQFIEDVQNYWRNQANGYRGDGRKLVRPSDLKEGTVPAENPNYDPAEVSKHSLEVINLLMGIELPRNSSVASRFAAKMARENGLSPTLNEAGVEVTNPLTADLIDKGFDPNLLHSTVQQLSLDKLSSKLTPSDLKGTSRAVLATTRAGFMPRAEGNPTTREVADKYLRATGNTQEQHDGNVPVNPELAKKIADFYDEAQSAPEDPAVQKSYKALADETMAQYRAMQDAGIKIEPYTGKGEPYANSAAMRADVRDNKHLYFYKTEGAFEGGADNALLQPSGVKIDGHELLVNDVFRAVHDYFGHTTNGYEFGPRGELNAYLQHSKMFSDEAKPALAAETLAQNSWVNFGRHLRREDGTIPQQGDADYIPLAKRPFAEQKNIVVPPHLIAGAEGRPVTYADRSKTFGGRLISADLVRTEIPGYDPKDPGATHEEASKESSRLLQDAFDNPDVHAITFMGGPAGAGKTTIARGLLAAEPDRVSFDSTLGGRRGADRVRKSIEAGKATTVQFVYAPFDVATGRIVSRYHEEGRTVPASSIIENYRGSIENFLALHDKFGDNPLVQFRVTDNSGATPAALDNGAEFLHHALQSLPDDATLKEQLQKHPEIPAEKTDAGATQGAGRLGSTGRDQGPEGGNRPPGSLAEVPKVAPAEDNTSYAVKPLAERGGQRLRNQSAKYMPAAIKNKETGEIAEGDTHYHATINAAKSGWFGNELKENPYDFPDNVRGKEWDRIVNSFEDGFTDPKTKEFLTREEAYSRAKSRGYQVPKDTNYLNSEDLNASFMPRTSVQHAGEPLEHSVGGELNLVHFGGTGMKDVDPKNFGKSGITPSSELAGAPRSYFYEQGKAHPSDVTNRPGVYGAKVSGDRIYDGDADKLGYAKIINREKADQMLQDQGYVGIARTGKAGRKGYRQVELFEPTKVQPLANQDATFMPAAPKPGAEEWVDQAAIKVGKRIFTGRDHSEAYDKLLDAEEAGEIPQDSAGQLSWSDSSGFVNNKGKYLSREDSMSLAKAAGQITPEGYAAAVTPGYERLASSKDLESTLFNNAKFMPRSTPAQEKALKDSKVRGPDGKLLPVFHGTYSDFKKFKQGDLGYHFGTEDAANARIGDAIKTGEVPAEQAFNAFPEMRSNLVPHLRGMLETLAEGARTLPVFLDIKNPLRMKDVGPWDDPEEVLFALPPKVLKELPKSVGDDADRFVAWTNDYAGPTKKYADAKAVKAKPVLAAIREGLKSLGYDGVVYKNDFEGSRAAELDRMGIPHAPSNNDSYIAFDNKQIVPAYSADAKARFMPKIAVPGADELVDARDTRAYRDIAKNLTPEESDKIRADTAQSLVDIYKELPPDADFEAASHAGLVKKGWYQRASDTLSQIFGPDKERFVGLLAATSPRQSVQENLQMSLNIWTDWVEAGRPLDTETLTPIIKKYAELHARVLNSIKALQGYEPELSGNKVEAFRKNLLGDMSVSTNDTWMALFGNLDQTKFATKSGHLAFTAKIRKVADKLDLKPAEVQETVWSFFKTLTEATTVKRTAKEALRSLSDSDILNTPEFHDEIVSNPKVRAQLDRLGFVGLDQIRDREDSQKPVGRLGSLAAVAEQEGGAGRLRVLERIAGRAQRLSEAQRPGAALAETPGENPF